MLRICLYASPVTTKEFLRQSGISSVPVIGAHGKPSLPGTGLFFNKSDSGSLTAFALSDECEVGIDLQEILPYKDRYDRLARRFFRPEEQEALALLEGDRRAESFFRLWTIKESYLKYTGRGIGGGLSSFRIDFENRLILPDQGGTAAFRIFTPECLKESYVLSLCAGSLPASIPILYKD